MFRGCSAGMSKGHTSTKMGTRNCQFEHIGQGAILWETVSCQNQLPVLGEGLGWAGEKCDFKSKPENTSEFARMTIPEITFLHD